MPLAAESAAPRKLPSRGACNVPVNAAWNPNASSAQLNKPTSAYGGRDQHQWQHLTSNQFVRGRGGWRRMGLGKMHLCVVRVVMSHKKRQRGSELNALQSYTVRQGTLRVKELRVRTQESHSFQRNADVCTRWEISSVSNSLALYCSKNAPRRSEGEHRTHLA